MSFGWRRFPGGTVYALCDGTGPFFRDRNEAFPDASAQTWAAADRYDPAAVDEAGQWILHFHCYAIRFEDGRTVLVDAGIGPADAPSKAWAPVPGRLPKQLARAEIDPAAVDTVVLTHLDRAAGRAARRARGAGDRTPHRAVPLRAGRPPGRRAAY